MSLLFTIVIFALVLVSLIVVHEFGHFIVAKLSGMRVDEFGIGYPPRIAGIKYGETEYTLNALPFGGFVRIFGEDDPELKGSADPRAFASRPRILQAATLVAGIVMNLFLAYLLITATLVMGKPQALDTSQIAGARNVQLMVAEVLPGSPAASAGLMQGDAILSVSGNGAPFSSTDSAAFSQFIGSDSNKAPLTLSILRNEKPLSIVVTPATGILKNSPERPGLGVALAPVGIVPVSLLRAPVEGAILTWEVTKETAVGLVKFFGSFFTFRANLAQVAGPVGIASTVSNAAQQGLAQLLSISAIISINLAIINLLPIPALDGGRLLFVIIESIIRRPIKSSVAQTVNGVGFVLLIILMVVVTGHDILKLVM